MRRRSRRNRPTNILGAFLIEAGTILAIVALAQPTWTSHLIEQFSSASPRSASSTPVEAVISQAGVFPAAIEAAFASVGDASHGQAMQVPASSGPSRVLQSASDTTERLAMARWSAPSLALDEYNAAPQYSQYSVRPHVSYHNYSTGPQLNPPAGIRPIYPPPAANQSMPAWSNSY